jgi:long-chain fatty acid transport protein
MKRKASLVFFTCALTAIPALGNGFYVPVQAPEATSRGNAWLATADTAAAVYYNAAGLTQIDSPEVIVGAYGVMLGLKADLDSGAYEKGNNDWAFLPQVYAAVPINDRLVAGFGVNTPFGLSTDWDDDSQFRALATETELTYATAWAVLGYRLTDTLSVGGGIGVSHADLKLARYQVIPTGPGTFAEFPSEFTGDDEGVSWTLSTRWQPNDCHAFGLVYRSKTDYTLEGDFDISGVIARESAESEFMTPATLAGGYAFTPCEEWTFELNIEWVNWDQLNSLDLSSESTGTTSLPFNWESNFIYSVGATRNFDNGWNVSAGYNFIENSIPDSNFNPGVSDANRHWLNAGFGRKHESFRWNVAYQYAFSDNEVSGSPGGLADGEFKSRFHGVMANLNWQF